MISPDGKARQLADPFSVGGESDPRNMEVATTIMG